MSIKQILAWQDLAARHDLQVVGRPQGHRHVGHAHFWNRAMTRRQFITTAAGLAGATLSSGLWMPALVHAAKPAGAAPRPIPGGIQPFGPGTEVFHVFPPGRGNEPSTITDFNGFVGIAEIAGAGTGTNTATGETSHIPFDVDMRFMEGEYVGVDGKHHHGTFGFI